MSSSDDSESESKPNNTDNVAQNDPNEDYGYYFFPRRHDKKLRGEGTFFDRFKASPFDVRSGKFHFNCINNTKRCLINDPTVNLMVRAMKAHGCPVEHDRHIVCEPCRLKISGGMDYVNNQILVCENNSRNLASVCNVVGHELLHAFDKCRAKLDFKNPYHIACTEIRAANLFHCSFLAATVTGSAGPLNIKQQQQQCVRDKALLSLMIARNVSREEGEEIIDKVFDKCYNDLEPVGRRLRKMTNDQQRALVDADLYGYFR